GTEVLSSDIESVRSHSGIWQSSQAAEWVEAPWNGCLPSTLMSQSAVSTGAEGRRRALRRRHRNSQNMASMAKLLLAALVVTTPAQARKGDHSFTGEYTVSFLGLPVATSQFNSTFRGGAYSVKGAFSAAGLARIFDDTQGSISATGRIEGDRVRPIRFQS